ncbi:MAG: ATP-binding protein [Spirochaetota bacterium]
MHRYVHDAIAHDITRKMVLLSGPRQCGKTTLARHIMEQYPKSIYLNWDSAPDRRIVQKGAIDESSPLIVLDEIHKFRNWKNMLKGLYDTRRDAQHFLVTGSARLDVYRRGGDSLLGRYHHWRLHPITADEPVEGMSVKDVISRLLVTGGFPEPFLGNDEREARRWRTERWDRVIKEDIRDLEAVRELGSLTMLLDLLKSRVGSPVVMSNLAEDLQVTSRTVLHWIEILERMYVIFRVFPLTAKVVRAIQKPPKIFFYDIADVDEDMGMRAENLIAAALLKRCHFLSDRDGYRYELRYIRDKEKREVDLVVLRNGVLLDAVEVKVNDDAVSKPLIHFRKHLNIPNTWQLSLADRSPAVLSGIMRESFSHCLSRTVITDIDENCASVITGKAKDVSSKRE